MLDRRTTDDILARLGPERVIAELESFLSSPRRERIDAVLAGRIQGVHVALEEPYDPHNAAAVVRSVEALGAAAVHVIQASTRVLTSRRTTQGAFHWIERAGYEDTPSFVASARARGLRLFGAAMDGQRALSDLPIDAPLCLLFGNEHRGLSCAARNACDELYRIPMYGFSESLNLSVSAAISLYDVLSRRRAWLGRDSDLSAAECLVERARCYLQAVDPRFATGLGGAGSRSGADANASSESS